MSDKWMTIDSAPKDGTILLLYCPKPLERLPKADPILSDPKVPTISRPLFDITIRDLDLYAAGVTLRPEYR